MGDRIEMIEPLRKGEPYPGVRPRVREQWSAVDGRVRAVLIGVPSLVVVLLLIVYPAAGLSVGVLALGAAAATAVYAKNRTDRHNAAVERGEIHVPPDPNLRLVRVGSLDPRTTNRLVELGYSPDGLKRLRRFDGGWLAEKGSGRELAVVVGDDGDHAYYDPRWVPPIRAATEYLAGRGREASQ